MEIDPEHEEYESVIEMRIFNLHETEIRPRQTFSNNLRIVHNVIFSFDDLSSCYVAMKHLLFTMVGVIGIVAYARWRLHCEADAV